MPFTVKYREMLDDGAEREFDQLTKRLKAFLLKEHNEDGTHLPGGSNRNIGEVVMYLGSTAPAGWLMCDGALVSRATYKALLSVAGTNYGPGDGNTNFQLPDLRQRVPLGKATSGTGSTLGATGGDIDHRHSGPGHTHSISSGGAHTHTVSGSTASESSHTHSFDGTTDGPNGSAGPFAFGVSAPAASDDHDHDFSGTTDAGSAHSHTAGTLAADSGGSHDHGGATGSSGTGNTGTANPPFQVVNFIVFTGVGV